MDTTLTVDGGELGQATGTLPALEARCAGD